MNNKNLSINYNISRTLLDELVPSNAGKAQRRKLQIIEKSIEEFAAQGVEGASYARIAEKCGISRVLVQSYFSDREELFLLCVKLVRAQLQSQIVESVIKGKIPHEQLLGYVRAVLRWSDEYPSQIKLWLNFYTYCVRRKKFRELNSELGEVGRQRVEAILEAGRTAGDFKFSQGAVLAKIIQSLVTGAALTKKTEDLPENLSNLETEIENQVLALVGYQKKN